MTDTAAPRFEGSYLGAAAKISERAVMECKICWTPYDPAEGDETRQVPPGTPFAFLPEDWKCPTCDAPREQFMVLEDAGAPGMSAEGDKAVPAAMAAAVARLEAEFREIHNAKMRDVPFCNKALHVEAVGFRAWEGGIVGVLITPWFMNLTLLPGAGEDWSGLATGEKELIEFPSGRYEFIHTHRSRVGGYKGCSLFSPMADFTSQLQAGDVARAVMHALFDKANRAETDRRDEIRELRAGEPEAVAAPDPERAPSRRAVITGGLAARTEADG